MTEGPDDKPWPPLIVAAHIPRLVRWRDALLTALAWAAFAFLLEKELRLVVGALQALEFREFGVEAQWLTYLERLTPFLLAVAVLAALLVGFSIRTLRRRSRSLLLPQPTALSAADQARRAGIEEGALVAARDQRIVVVHIDDIGIRIETTREVSPWHD